VGACGETIVFPNGIAVAEAYTEQARFRRESVLKTGSTKQRSIYFSAVEYDERFAKRSFDLARSRLRNKLTLLCLPMTKSTKSLDV
jgi:hypothetical protein